MTRQASGQTRAGSLVRRLRWRTWSWWYWHVKEPLGFQVSRVSWAWRLWIERKWETSRWDQRLYQMRSWDWVEDQYREMPEWKQKATREQWWLTHVWEPLARRFGVDYGPGKFEGCRSYITGEYLYDLSLEGWCETTGDNSEWILWSALIPGPFPFAGAAAIITEDSYGFVDYELFDTLDEATAKFREFEQEYDEAVSEPEEIVEVE